MEKHSSSSSSSSLPFSRPGGRASNSLRPLICELACLGNADGSALFQMGSTHVLASVQGPVAPRLPQHESTMAQVSVILKSGPLVNKTYELEWEEILTQVLTRAIVVEAYPRSVIQIVVQIISADGSVLAAALNAAISALLDCGIDMRYLPTAVTCLVVNHNNKNNKSLILLDPSSEEEQAPTAGTVVLVTHDSSTILASHTSNINISVETLLQCCTVAFRASPAIAAFWRLAVEQKVAREAQTLWSNTMT